MTDREMLELAAKAAGIAVEWKDWGRFDWRDGLPTVLDDVWNPLTDDGDALRLAADLRIAIKPGKYAGDGATAEPVNGRTAGATVFDDAGMEAQMRKAIVMVAAEIGKAMQETTS